LTFIKGAAVLEVAEAVLALLQEQVDVVVAGHAGSVHSWL